MRDKIAQFLKISKYAGMREDLVQAGGGNSSVKLDGKNMLIKSSGVQLAEVTSECGFAKINFVKLRRTLDIETCTIGNNRPSIESVLHALTSGLLSLHTHPLAVNMLVCKKGGLEVLVEMFPQALFIDYATPGFPLAKKYMEVAKDKTSNLAFLKNHGLMVSGESADEVISLTENVLLQIETKLGVNFSAYRHATKIYHLLLNFDSNINFIHYCRTVELEFAAKNGAFRYDFCPDCLVYCGKKPLILEDANDVEKYYSKYGRPSVIWHDEHFYVASDNLQKAREVESVLAFAAKVAFTVDGDGEYLTEQEQNFLLNWDAEKYRKNV